MPFPKNQKFFACVLIAKTACENLIETIDRTAKEKILHGGEAEHAKLDITTTVTIILSQMRAFADVKKSLENRDDTFDSDTYYDIVRTIRATKAEWAAIRSRAEELFPIPAPKRELLRIMLDPLETGMPPDFRKMLRNGLSDDFPEWYDFLMKSKATYGKCCERLDNILPEFSRDASH